MSKIYRLLLSISLGLLTLAMLAMPARADNSVDALDVSAELKADGTLTVTSTLTGDVMGSDLQMRIPKHSPLGDLRRFLYDVSGVAVTADAPPSQRTLDRGQRHRRSHL